MRSIYKKLFHYVPDKRIWAYFSMALSAAAVCSYMGAYWFLWQSIVSILVIPVYEKAMYDAIIVVILMILRGIFNIASATCSHYLGFRLETNLRKNGLHKLLDASSSFFDHNSSGEIRKIIDDNAAETHKTVAHLIPDNVTAVMTPVLMFVLMFAIDYRLGILLILTTVIGVLQYRKMSGGTEFLSGYSAALQKMSAATVEYVRGMQIIKIFGVTVQYYKTLINSIKEYKQYVYQYSLSCKNPYVGFQVLFNVFYAFAVPAAVVFISYGEPAMLILAKIVFFAVFSGAVFTSFTSIMFTGQDNFGAQNTLNQLDELTTSMDQAKLPHGNEETFQDFNIEFRHVDFKYDDNFVLKDFSLTLHQNKTYALIGSSGGGKSTIAKLISGFYPVDGGEILIGGKNIQSYSEKALIQNIAFVFQRSQLLKTSIYENVRIGNPQATRQQIMDALDAANCTSILDKFPRREMTVIGAKGVYLSGGEVQRIAIARAILKNANIVIMDEASAAADPENEYELQQAFQKLMRGKTVIMIAHRLSSIQNVDQILFVQNGKVVEQGTHNELMACNGRYKDFQDVYCKAKAVVPAFPDHPAPKALVCREQEEGRFVPVRQTPAAFPPMCPSSSVCIGQEELRDSFSELLMHPFSELRSHRGCEAVPHKLIQLQYTCFDPFLQTGAFIQAARMLAIIVLAVFARHIFGRVMKWAAVYPTASGFLTGLRHHQLLQRLQRRVSHEIVRHKRTPL